MPRLPVENISLHEIESSTQFRVGCFAFGIPVRIEDALGNDLGDIYIYGDISERDYTVFIKPFPNHQFMTVDSNNMYVSSYDGALIEARPRVGGYSDYGYDNSGSFAVVFTRFVDGGYVVLDSVVA